MLGAAVVPPLGAATLPAELDEAAGVPAELGFIIVAAGFAGSVPVAVGSGLVWPAAAACESASTAESGGASPHAESGKASKSQEGSERLCGIRINQ